MNTNPTRRRLLSLTAAMPLAWLGLALRPLSALAADWPKSLFAAATSQDAINQLQAQKAEAGLRVLLEVPDISEQGDRVLVRVMSTLPNTEQITILVDKALRPVVAQFVLQPDTEADVSTYIKLPGTSTIRAVVKAAGKTYVVSREIKLTMEPWGDAPAKVSKPGPRKKAEKA